MHFGDLKGIILIKSLWQVLCFMLNFDNKEHDKDIKKWGSSKWISSLDNKDKQATLLATQVYSTYAIN